MFRAWILTLRSLFAVTPFPQLFRSRNERRKARRLRPQRKLRLERLEDRVTPSATSMDSQPASQPIVAALEQQAMQFIVTASVTVQNEASIIWRAISQEFAQVRAYFVLQLDQILGIAPNLQNPSLISSKPTPGNGAATISHIASNQQPRNSIPPVGDGSGSGSGATIKPLDAPGGPNIVGFGGFTWNPTDGNLASKPQNWLLAEKPQGADGMKPGPGSAVAFDPGDPNAKNGGAPITWDYPATFDSMSLFGQQGAFYTGQQTINSGIKVEMTGGGGESLGMPQPTGQSHLNSPANLAEYVRETPRSSRRSTASPSSSVCL